MSIMTWALAVLVNYGPCVQEKKTSMALPGLAWPLSNGKPCLVVGSSRRFMGPACLARTFRPGSGLLAPFMGALSPVLTL